MSEQKLTLVVRERNAPEVEAELVLVDGKTAKKWLERCNTRNRRLSEKHWRRLSHDMMNGHWVFTGMPIIFTKDNTLANGQHTLQAIVHSETEQWCLVVGGVEKDAILAMDRNKMRNFGDHLSIDKTPHYATVASITRYLYCYQHGLYHFGDAPSMHELQQVLDDNPEIHQAADFVVINRPDLSSMGENAMWGFLRVLTQASNPVKSDEFFNKLMGRAECSANDACLHLRRKLQEDRLSKQGKLRVSTKIAYCIKTWNNHLKGRDLRNLRFQQGGEKPEDFPTVL